MYFDRFNICEAYYAFAVDYEIGGDAYTTSKRGIFQRLRRMHFKVSPLFKGYESLDDNGKDIYRQLEERYGVR